MAYKPIGHYGLIGGMSSAALVGLDGSIDWCCFPRFDSPSVFAAILDDRKGGRFQIAPTDPDASAHQTYLPNTNILSTRFTTSTGELSLLDFMPVSSPDSSNSGPHEVHRIVRCTGGSVEVHCTFQPRPDYARVDTALAPIRSGVVARGGRQELSLCSEAPLEINGTEATVDFNSVPG